MALSAYSRYLTTRVVTIAGIQQFVEWTPPNYDGVEEQLYIVGEHEINRPDLISYAVYGIVDLWWVVLDYNSIADPFSLNAGDRLKIPVLTDIKSILLAMAAQGPRPILDPAEASAAESLPNAPVGLATPTVIPPFVRLLTPAEAAVQTTIATTPVESAGFNFGFDIPTGLTGLAQFQLEVASDAGFTDIVMSRLTTSSQVSWFYYDPYVNSQAGGFVAFPALGVDGATYSGQTVFYSVQISDPLVHGTQYYFRYRAWINQLEGVWYVPAPILF